MEDLRDLCKFTTNNKNGNIQNLSKQKELEFRTKLSKEIDEEGEDIDD